MTAEEALEWQLINRVLDDDQLKGEAVRLAKTLSVGPLQTHGMIKQLLSDTFSSELESQMEAESRRLATALSGEEGQEGIRAFLEKRKPRFPGSE